MFSEKTITQDSGASHPALKQARQQASRLSSTKADVSSSIGPTTLLMIFLLPQGTHRPNSNGRTSHKNWKRHATVRISSARATETVSVAD